jgi:hypothetical protein
MKGLSSGSGRVAIIDREGKLFKENNVCYSITKLFETTTIEESLSGIKTERRSRKVPVPLNSAEGKVCFSTENFFTFEGIVIHFIFM